MSYSKRLLDGISDEELEQIFGRSEEQPWPSQEEIDEDERGFQYERSNFD